MNLRVIKKDIDYIIDELIADALLMLNFDKSVEPAFIEEIINEAIQLRDDLYKRVNHPDKKNTKAHYRAVVDDLFEQTDKLFERLSKKEAAK